MVPCPCFLAAYTVRLCVLFPARLLIAAEDRGGGLLPGGPPTRVRFHSESLISAGTAATAARSFSCKGGECSLTRLSRRPARANPAAQASPSCRFLCSKGARSAPCSQHTAQRCPCRPVPLGSLCTRHAANTVHGGSFEEQGCRLHVQGRKLRPREAPSRSRPHASVAVGTDQSASDECEPCVQNRVFSECFLCVGLRGVFHMVSHLTPF